MEACAQQTRCLGQACHDLAEARRQVRDVARCVPRPATTPRPSRADASSLPARCLNGTHVKGTVWGAVGLGRSARGRAARLLQRVLTCRARADSLPQFSMVRAAQELTACAELPGIS